MNARAPTFNWESTRHELRKRYPKATDGILFCLSKLRTNSTLTIPDFRDEAMQLDIKLGGRALHSARELLSKERSPISSLNSNGNGVHTRENGTSMHASNASTDRSSSTEQIEANLIRVVQQIQSQATDESRRLRDAIQRALHVVRNVLVE